MKIKKTCFQCLKTIAAGRLGATFNGGEKDECECCDKCLSKVLGLEILKVLQRIDSKLSDLSKKQK
jgi:hypothetical protein